MVETINELVVTIQETTETDRHEAVLLAETYIKLLIGQIAIEAANG